MYDQEFIGGLVLSQSGTILILAIFHMITTGKTSWRHWPTVVSLKCFTCSMERREIAFTPSGTEGKGPNWLIFKLILAVIANGDNLHKFKFNLLYP